MEHEGFVYGMVISGYLLALVLLLVLFLVWKKVPRREVFGIVEISVGIFAGLVPICYSVADRLVLHGCDSFLVYVGPVIPAAIFVAWTLRRLKRHVSWRRSGRYSIIQ